MLYIRDSKMQPLLINGMITKKVTSAVGPKKKKKEKNTSIYFNTSYRRNETGIDHHRLLSTSI